jgi:hypothetical protein
MIEYYYITYYENEIFQENFRTLHKIERELKRGYEISKLYFFSKSEYWILGDYLPIEVFPLMEEEIEYTSEDLYDKYVYVIKAITFEELQAHLMLLELSK